MPNDLSEFPQLKSWIYEKTHSNCYEGRIGAQTSAASLLSIVVLNDASE